MEPCSRLDFKYEYGALNITPCSDTCLMFWHTWAHATLLKMTRPEVQGINTLFKTQTRELYTLFKTGIPENHTLGEYSLSNTFVKCICRNISCAKENGACTRGEILSRLSLSYTSMAMNADQRKWRQVRISAVSHQVTCVHKAVVPSIVQGGSWQAATGSASWSWSRPTPRTWPPSSLSRTSTSQSKTWKMRSHLTTKSAWPWATPITRSSAPVVMSYTSRCGNRWNTGVPFQRAARRPCSGSARNRTSTSMMGPSWSTRRISSRAIWQRVRDSGPHLWHDIGVFKLYQCWTSIVPYHQYWTNCTLICTFVTHQSFSKPIWTI